MSKRAAIGLVMLMAIGAVEGARAGTIVVSDAAKITIGGRIHVQLNTSSVDSAATSELRLRRARIELGAKFNETVSGVVAPDFGSGVLLLKDAYMQLDFGEQWRFRFGQFLRPFDVFRNTSSNRIQVIERDGKVRGVSNQVSYTKLTEDLGYSDRDVGIYGVYYTQSRKLRLEASLTTGTDESTNPGDPVEETSDKQFIVQAVVEPTPDLSLYVGGASKPYTEFESTPDSSANVRIASAAQIGLEYGNWESGPHVIGGVVSGENWRAQAIDPPEFVSTQVIASYKFLMEDETALFEAVEPVIRFSYADPDRDTKDDGGFLVTPAIQFFIAGESKVSLDLDIFSPERSGQDTELSFKIQSYFIF